MSTLEKLKLRLGIVDDKQDKLLELFLEDAKSEISDYCKVDFIESMEPVQRELAVIYFNRQGTEGEISRSEGGISINYGTDIPGNLQRRLDKFKKVKVIRY
ncbi:MAG: phage head-tail connector protein [Sarcina sp.]